MKKVRMFFCTLVLFFVMGAGVCLADSLWVTSAGATLKANPSASAASKTSLVLGEELDLVRPKGRWYRVKTQNGLEGWIYRGKVSTEQPEIEEEEGSEGFLDDFLAENTKSTIESGAADTSRSIRGLSPEAEAYAKTSGTPVENQKALDAVLEMRVPQNRVEQFLRQGQIGEYAP